MRGSGTAQQVRYWRSGAEGDWRVGVALIRSRKTRHGLFFLHLALEKVLKAHVCQTSGTHAPRIHALPVLAERSGVGLTTPQRNVLMVMDRYNLAGRYPDAWSHPPRGQSLRDLVRRCREVYRCLVDLL